MTFDCTDCGSIDHGAFVFLREIGRDLDADDDLADHLLRLVVFGIHCKGNTGGINLPGIAECLYIIPCTGCKRGKEQCEWRGSAAFSSCPYRLVCGNCEIFNMSVNPDAAG